MKSKNVLDGRALANILPEIKRMRERGISAAEIGRKYKLSETTVYHYLNGYNTYLNGKTNFNTKALRRALPYLKHYSMPFVNTKEKPQPKSAKYKEIKRMSGKELADTLPRIFKMRHKGLTYEEIGQVFDLSKKSTSRYYLGYKDYLSGEKTQNIEHIRRAIPYLEGEARPKLQPERVIDTKPQPPAPAPVEVEPKPKREISILWGLISVKIA